MAWKRYNLDLKKRNRCLNLPLWNTFYLVHPNLILKKNKLQKQGINYINNLRDESGNLYGYLDFVQKINIRINFVGFYSLIHSHPRPWHLEISEFRKKLDDQNMSQKVLLDLLKFDQVCKRTYWIFMKLCNTKSRITEQKWSHALNENISHKTLQEYFVANLTSTIDSKLRSFQFIILQRILTTNKFLKICKIQDNDKCSF